MSEKVSTDHDPVNHPSHYTSHPSGVECIQITQHMSFCLGNAIKYIFRREDKGALLQDLKKAEFYVNQEIKRITSTGRWTTYQAWSDDRELPEDALFAKFIGHCEPGNLTSAMKLIWNAGGIKSSGPVQDLDEAAEFISREIERLGNSG